jgi:hypothetical protein
MRAGHVGAWAVRTSAFAGVAILAAASIGAQCQGDPAVSFEVNLPASLSSTAQWMEVGVIAGACPPPSQLAGGLPATGLVERIAFAHGNASPPALGSLKKGSYAFAAVARAADCSVVATGCSEVDVTNARDVEVTLAPTSPPAGACLAGTTCFDARCVPGGSVDDAGGDGGASACTLSFVGAGPLGDPLGVTPDVVSSPAAVATESGFLVAYREYDPTGGAAQLTVASIASTGVLAIGGSSMLPSQCPSQTETDAVGFGYASGGGIVASARPACGSQPGGYDLFGVSASGTLGKTAFSASPSGPPALSPHSVALTNASVGYMASTVGGNASITALSGLFPAGAPLAIGPAGGATLAQVVTDGAAIAWLAGGSASTSDAGPASPALSLALGASFASLAPSVSIPGTTGALALTGTRAVVLSDSTVAAQPVAWSTVDPSSTAAQSSTFSVAGASGPVAGFDAATRGDLAFFAVESSGAIVLEVFADVTSTPTLLRTLSLGSDPRVPIASGLRDGRIAVAANDSQLLVTWVTGTTLGPSDPVGGWALYACPR